MVVLQEESSEDVDVAVVENEHALRGKAVNEHGEGEMEPEKRVTSPMAEEENESESIKKKVKQNDEE